jgi:hypothetical protein
MQYPWYARVTDAHILQGDIFDGYPVFEPVVTVSDIADAVAGKESATDIPIKVKMMNVIVLSQSCDLENAKIDSVILCPIWTINDAEASFGTSSTEVANRKEQIRRGVEPAMHMLNSDTSIGVPISLVEFKRIYTTPKKALQATANSAGARTRLLPPYREHLSQAFARYFMRVGLPTDIPKFA